MELTKAEELKNLAARSMPAISKYTASAENGMLQLDAMLEVRLITVNRKLQ